MFTQDFGLFLANQIRMRTEVIFPDSLVEAITCTGAFLKDRVSFPNGPSTVTILDLMLTVTFSGILTVSYFKIALTIAL